MKLVFVKATAKMISSKFYPNSQSQVCFYRCYNQKSMIQKGFVPKSLQVHLLSQLWKEKLNCSRSAVIIVWDVENCQVGKFKSVLRVIYFKISQINLLWAYITDNSEANDKFSRNISLIFVGFIIMKLANDWKLIFK